MGAGRGDLMLRSVRLQKENDGCIYIVLFLVPKRSTDVYCAPVLSFVAVGFTT